MGCRRLRHFLAVGLSNDETQNVAFIILIRGLVWKPRTLEACLVHEASISISLLKQCWTSGNSYLLLSHCDLLPAFLHHSSYLEEMRPRLLLHMLGTNEVLQRTPRSSERLRILIHQHHCAHAAGAHDGPHKGSVQQVRGVELLQIVLVVGKGANPIGTDV
eukprot:Skav234229  [mRNA]  locus=scaffold1464:256004:260630:- [translate_table: standard]